MSEMLRIHLSGPSGSGTTTLGRELARRIGCAHYDTDSFYWQACSVPFSIKRPPEERLELLQPLLNSECQWVLSGSAGGWGRPLEPLYDLVVLMDADQATRIARLQHREAKAFGAAILPGGPMHAIHEEFIEWAKQYDNPEFTGRSRVAHRQWFEGLTCRKLICDGTMPIDKLADEVLGFWFSGDRHDAASEG